MSTYRRIQHAAHYAYSHPAGGHDLEQWDATEAATGAPPATVKMPSDVPFDAHYHYGYVDRDGVQHWVFTRTARLSGDACSRCRR